MQNTKYSCIPLHSKLFELKKDAKYSVRFDFLYEKRF